MTKKTVLYWQKTNNENFYYHTIFTRNKQFNVYESYVRRDLNGNVVAVIYKLTDTNFCTSSGYVFFNTLKEAMEHCDRDLAIKFKLLPEHLSVLI